ncbi:MAG: small ribosomal subunit Rsm22 family protein [Terriglobales bacterium]
MRLSEELQDAIADEAASVERSALVRAAQELSAQYQRGDFRSAALPTDAHRIAYLQTRLPATYAANAHAFAAIKECMAGVELKSLLDLGAGPGTSMWAAAAAFPGIRRITAVERDPALLALGRRLAARNPNESVRTGKWVRADIAAYSPDAHDLVVLSYALGELFRPEAIIARAWQATHKLLVIVDPGTPRNFQHVLAARAWLIGAGAHLVAPCPHHNLCPLAMAGDWCHFAERVERTAEHRRMKGGTLGYEDEKFSYMAAARSAVTWPRARILRHPQFHSGHVQLTLCTALGLQRQTVGKSQKDVYRAARRARWGDAWEY